MRLQLYIDELNHSNVTLVDSLTVTQDSTEAISTAQFDVFASYSGGARYDESFYDAVDAVYGFDLVEYQVVELRDADAGPTSRFFSGLIVAIDKRADNQHLVWSLRCVDWGGVLDRTVINQTWPAGTTDAQIVQDVIAQLDPRWGISSDPAGIFVIANDLGVVTAKDITARQLLEDVCELTGGEWHITYDRKARYYKPGSFVPAFNLSDHPDGVTSVAFNVENYTRDFTNATNRVTVLGAVLADGTELKTVMDHTQSQATYGVLSRTVIDRSITNPVQLQLRALTEVNTYALPRYQLTAEVYTPGAARGQTMRVTTSLYSLDLDLIVRTVSVNVIAPDRAKAKQAGDGRAHHVARWHVTLGTRQPDFIYALRRAQRQAQGASTVPAAVIPPGSITPGQIIDGFEFIQGVDTLPPLPDPNFSDDAVVFLRSDRQLYRRTGNTWTAYVDAASITGQITTPQLAPGSVVSTVLADGAVVSAKIPTGAIVADKLGPGAVTGPAIAADAVTANSIAAGAIGTDELSAGAVITTKLAAGAVTANIIAANAIAAEHVQANAITAGKIAANAVVAGNIAALAIQAGNIAANAVTAGTIAAFAVAAGNIQAGAISASHIQSGVISSDKLNANEIQLGYGANRPTVFTVWNVSSQVIAAIGDLALAPGSGLPTNTHFGIWAKVAGFGKNNYGDAPIYTDVSGNLFIRDASVTITAADGAAIVTSPTTFDATYGTLALSFSKGGDAYTRVINRGIVLYDGTLRRNGAFVRSPTSQAAELTIYPASGFTFNILLSGATGVGRFDGGVQVGADLGLTQNVTIGGVTLRFRGGVFIGT